MLRRPHLMLSNSSRNDDISLLVSRLHIELLNHLLRLHFLLPRRALVVCERIFGLPFSDIAKPRLARGGADERDEGAEVLGDVAEDRDASVDDFVDVFGLDLEVDDSAAFLGRCCSSSGGECYIARCY